ncbi:MAG: aromatic ring-hydroxylating dioxygenase subunit alpha [Alphaproteobacteria bacterium]|nr:aromatic ring-hydroxylating dioxygenase subunit alpha [Alphaproteobacteria bacterium]
MTMALSRQELQIEPIARASTIPAQWYVDPDMLELEKERVFGRSWQLVGHTGQVAEPGAYFTCEVGGEPLVVVRGQDGIIRAFSNVCRHRGGPVARGAGVLRIFHCAYHGWTYNLDGSLRVAPELGDIEAFDEDKVSLPKARVELLPPLVFVNLDTDAPPLAQYLGDFPDFLRRYDADKLRFIVQKRYEVAANWKILLDNFLECYHCPLLHRTTVAAKVDLRGYIVESHDWYSRHYFASAAPDKLAAAAAPVEQTVRHTYCFFPNYAINLLPGWLITFRVLPVAVDRSVVLREFFCDDQSKSPAELEQDGAMAYYAKVFAEDIEMVQLVQKQLRSRFYTRGRYSVRLEQGVYHFHSLLRRVLAEAA